VPFDDRSLERPLKRQDEQVERTNRSRPALGELKKIGDHGKRKLRENKMPLSTGEINLVAQVRHADDSANSFCVPETDRVFVRCD